MQQLKRALSCIVSLVLIVMLAGCGNASNDNSKSSIENQVTEAVSSDSAAEETESNEITGDNAGDSVGGSDEIAENADKTASKDGNEILVVYFSREGEQYSVGVIDKGNTEIVAEMIADETGADLYEVIPAEDNYPTTYGELTDMAKKEQNEKARPAYADTVPDLSGYSIIFIGAPVWWGDWPMIMYTFFENEDLSGKTLIPFSTHEGSGLSGFDSKLSSACPDSEVKEGLAVRGSDAQSNQDSVRSAVNDWIAGLGY